MNKVLTALGVVLVALLAIQTAAASDATMHNCPQDGEWAIVVWTGERTSAGEALGTCSIEIAYALTPTGAWLRYTPDIPEINTLETIEQYEGVIALGGPPVPIVPEPTNISVFGEFPDRCTDLAMAIGYAGGGQSQARVGLHLEPLPIIDGVATKTWTTMAFVKEICLYCDGFLQCVDVPEARGPNHRYTITVLVTGNDYEVLPREHEYMRFDCGKRPDGTIFMCRGYAGSKIPFNPTCPVRWEWHDDTGQICPGYPDAVFKARRCNPGETPVPGETYCLWYE